MKIENVSQALTQLPPEHVTVTVPSGPARTPSGTQDRTSFHSDASSVQSLASEALNSPQVRQDRVDALRQSVRSDEYQLNANRLADAIGGSGGK